VVGYDPSSTYLRIAERRSATFTQRREKRLKFINGDPYCCSDVLINNNQKNFDVIIIMDNSFGYMDSANDMIMLENLLRVANQKCILIMETENRDWRLLNFEPTTFFESDKMQMIARWKFHFETSISEGSVRFYERSSLNDRNLRLSLKLQMLMRLYSMHELIELICRAGWNYRESYDDIISLGPFSNSNMSIFTVSSSSQD
jgi:hypothetical protein